MEIPPTVRYALIFCCPGIYFIENLTFSPRAVRSPSGPPHGAGRSPSRTLESNGRVSATNSHHAISRGIRAKFKFGSELKVAFG